MSRTLIGVLTPSSNTVLEPATAAIVADFPDTSAHFSRFNVTRIALGADADAQFAFAPMLAAARLLADARVGVIAWSGTSASWLGFERDAALCRSITAETGIAACTAVGALNDLIARRAATRIGLVTPYTPDIVARIAANYAAAGITVAAEAHAGLAENFAFSTIDDETVAAMCRRVAAAGVDAVVIMCTNMRGATLMAGLEAETGVPILDSTAAVVWQAAIVAGLDPTRAARWGWMFRQAGGPST